ncbi:unnamed protein product [Calicophoron daubneyi]|uniref:LicD/FKTN/FKRP nucleotidyltransferase domain-containing protein n=1 Tax=Calicophoron daubneyi TaxID=300641 RepID=A0AAV2TSM6_CALDB
MQRLCMTPKRIQRVIANLPVCIPAYILLVIVCWSNLTSTPRGKVVRWRIFPYIIQNSTRKITLQLDEIERWIIEQKEAKTSDHEIVTYLLPVIRELCDVQQKHTEKCCDPKISVNSSLKDVLTCIRQLRSLGPMPTTSLVGTNDEPPEFTNFSMYIDRNRWNETELRCYVNLDKRRSMYRLLRHWITLANQYKIIWWITYGSLIGSIRHGDFIPYDHDVDIMVLGSQEELIRQLATDRKNFTYGQINIVPRARHCAVDLNGIRTTCTRRLVQFQLDPCSFCDPLARLISGYTTFFDIFLTHVELHSDRVSGTTEYGLLDETVDRNSHRLSNSISSTFPLSVCQYAGLSVPCPRNPKTVLSHIYGEDFRKPLFLCNQRWGYWYWNT